MNLPNLESAVVSTDKIKGYLLSENHPDGKHKAKFFEAFGYSPQSGDILENAVRQHAVQHEVSGVELSPFGTRYVIEGIMVTPDGRSPANTNDLVYTT